MEWPGEKVLTRLIETLERGVGGMLRPWQIRRVEGANTDARIKERLLLEQLERDIVDIKSGRKRVSTEGKLIPHEIQKHRMLERPEKTDEQYNLNHLEARLEIVSAAKATSDALALQQSVNLKRIALFAEEEAEQIDKIRGDSALPEEAEVDEDWFSRWRASAQDVKREEMQRLWASLLAGEVAQPGSFSLQTVNFLSLMSRLDAELISKLAPFQTSAGIMNLSNDFLSRHDLSFEELLHLSNIGIIDGVTGLGGLTSTPAILTVEDRFVCSLRCNNNVLIFDLGKLDEPYKSIAFPVYSITRIGREILSLAKFQSNDGYLQEIADFAIKMGAHSVKRGNLAPNGNKLNGVHVLAAKPEIQ